MWEIKEKIVHLEFIIPTRGLFGYRREFMTDTRGLGILNNLFYRYMPEKGEWKERERGSLVAVETAAPALAAAKPEDVDEAVAELTVKVIC